MYLTFELKHDIMCQKFFFQHALDISHIVNKIYDMTLTNVIKIALILTNI